MARRNVAILCCTIQNWPRNGEPSLGCNRAVGFARCIAEELEDATLTLKQRICRRSKALDIYVGISDSATASLKNKIFGNSRQNICTRRNGVLRIAVDIVGHGS